MLLKVCGLRDRKNIEEVLCREPDYLGFILYPSSPRGVDDQMFVALMQEFLERRTPKRIAVVVNRSLEELISLAKRADFAGFQLHGDESPEFCTKLQRLLPHMEITKVVGIKEEADLLAIPDYAGVVRRILLDTKTPQRGGSGKVFDWEILKRGYSFNVPFLLSGGLGPHNLKAALRAMEGLPCEGLDLNSKIESEPGIKSIELLDEAVVTIRELSNDK